MVERSIPLSGFWEVGGSTPLRSNWLLVLLFDCSAMHFPMQKVFLTYETVASESEERDFPTTLLFFFLL